MNRGRVVIECVGVGSDGLQYSVWTENDGHAFGEVRCFSYVEAFRELAERLEDGAQWVPEPGYNREAWGG